MKALNINNLELSNKVFYTFKLKSVLYKLYISKNRQELNFNILPHYFKSKYNTRNLFEFNLFLCNHKHDNINEISIALFYNIVFTFKIKRW